MSDTRRHQRRSREEWQRLIAEQRQSGLSQQAFCRDHGLVLATFCNWKRRLAETDFADTPDKSDWLELPASLSQTTVRHWDIELDLGNGICLRLRHR